MICPNCKHEYFKDAVCPSCGLTEDAALRKVADECLAREHFALAAEFYGKVLRRVPSDTESVKKQAVAWTRLALESLEAEAIQKAEASLREALRQDFNWDLGHQYRVLVAEKQNKLDELVREYQGVAAGGEPGPTNTANRMIQVIQLTLQFKTRPPIVTSTLPSPLKGTDLIAAFWPPFIGLPVAVAAAQAAISDSTNNRWTGLYMAIAAVAFLGSAVLTFFTSRRLKGRKTPAKKELFL